MVQDGAGGLYVRRGRTKSDPVLAMESQEGVDREVQTRTYYALSDFSARRGRELRAGFLLEESTIIPGGTKVQGERAHSACTR